MIEVVLNDRLVRAPAARMNTPVSPRVALVYPRDIPPRTAQRNLVPVVSPNPPSRLQGKKIRVKCNEDDTIGDLKKLVAAQTGTRAEKLRIQKWYNIYKDHITLEDYEIHDGMGLELYYN